MSLKDLPKSLVDSVSQILNQSNSEYQKLKSNITAEGLKAFGVKSVSELTEAQQRQFYAWAQKRLSESACGCGDAANVTEDDMPGDDVFHKDGEHSEKKKEMSEEDKAEKDFDGDGKIESGEDEYLGSRDKAIKAAIAKEEAEEDKKADEVSEEDQVELDDIKEEIAILPNQVATNGAVGVRDAEAALPVHADVLRDTNAADGSTELRLFVQWSTNVMPQIIPPPSIPGAATIDALRGLVEGLPFYCDVIESALVAAADVPHQRPEHKGVGVE